MKSETRTKLEPLTSLRFFAAAMIVMFHAGTRGLGPDLPMHLALGQGVSFFFVLSGFVLAYNYPRLSDVNSVKGFYVARIARIWPSHIASALLFILLIGNISYFSLPAGTRGLITLAYITLTQAWVPVSSFITAYNTVSWSISTEFFFYLVFPLLVARWESTWRLKLIATFCLAVVMWFLATQFAIAPNGTDEGRGNIGYINPLARLFEFTLGIGVCHLYREFGPRLASRLKPGRATLIEAITVLVVLVSLWLSHELATSASVEATLTKTASMVFGTSGFGTFVFAGMIFVFAIGAGSISRFLSYRPMVFLGELSFGLYLVHALFLLYRQQAPGVFDGVSNSNVYLLYWATGLALALLLHVGIERPCQLLIKSWYAGARGPKLWALATPLPVFAIVVALIVVLQPSARGPYPVESATGVVNLLKSPVDFDPGYRLDRVEILYADNKLPASIRFAWNADADLSLNKRVAVHLLDSSGKMTGQLDFAMETGFRSANRGEKWSNVISLANSGLDTVEVVGIAVYDASSMSSVAPSQRGMTDWNGQRLLVSIAEGRAPRADSGAFGDFVTLIGVPDIVGNWRAGSGEGHIATSDGSSLLLTTETGLKGVGSIHVDRIQVPGWNVSGRLSLDRKHIVWSNGFTWHRASPLEQSNGVAAR